MRYVPSVFFCFCFFVFFVFCFVFCLFVFVRSIGAFLQNRLPYLDDIWYVGGARAEGAHGEFGAWAWHMLVLWDPFGSKMLNNALGLPNLVKGHQRSNGGKLCAMATIFGQEKRWCKLRMMTMTLMEVKGHQRSNVVNYVLWLPYLVKRAADASWEWWWPSWGQRSSEVKYGNLCAMATIFGQKESLM